MNWNSDAFHTGSIAACSDARYKTDVQPLSGSLDRVMQMRGVAYRWRTEEYPERDFDEAGHLGFIAQELEALYPELVLTDAEGYRSVDYGRLTPVLVEAIKEQQGKIDRLQSQLELLTEMVRDLVAERNSVDRQKAGL